MAPKSITYGLEKVSSEIFNPMGIWNLFESASEWVPEGF